MNVILRAFKEQDIAQMLEVWNEVVLEGVAFPQSEPLEEESAKAFFGSQSFTGVAELDGKIVGLYILHPNNVGHCGHLSNASYAVKSSVRGMHIGEQLVRHSLSKAKELGFRILQFNAVVETNYGAIRLYEKLGFKKTGMVPEGFLMNDGTYANIILFYRPL